MSAPDWRSMGDPLNDRLPPPNRFPPAWTQSRAAAELERFRHAMSHPDEYMASEDECCRATISNIAKAAQT